MYNCCINVVQVFDFELSEDDMSKISQFNRDFRFVALTRDICHPLYPFKEPF